MVWVAFITGLFIGANLVALVIGLLVVAREAHEQHRFQGKDRKIYLHPWATAKHDDSMILKRREYANLN